MSTTTVEAVAKPRRQRSSLAWILWSVTLAGLVIQMSLVFSSRGSESGLGPESWPILLAVGLFVVSYATVGALIASKLPTSPIGWLSSATALLYVLAASFLWYAGGGRALDPRPGAEILFQVSTWMWLAAVILGGPLLILFFPSGRLPSGRWRIVATALIVGLVTFVLARTFSPGPAEPGARWENPIGITAAASQLEILARFGAVLLAIGSLTALASVFVRYRKAPSRQKEQLKWFFSALGAAAIFALPISFALEALRLYELSNLIVTVSLSLIPLSIGAAILRHRVFDIDIVINKALVYGALTAVLALTYLAIVVFLQRFIAPVTHDSDLAVAGSTLVVAALFRPIRDRVQSFIDHRFYRSRYDAVATLDAFSARLRDEVDLHSLSTEIVNVVAATMQPAHASLWVRTPTGEATR